MFFRAAVLLALFASTYGACPPVPDGACNICGEGKCVSKPDEIFSLPPNPSVACGDLQQAGFDGDEQVVTNCGVLSLLIRVCECDAVGVPATPAPVVAPTPSPVVAPTPAPVLVVVDTLPPAEAAPTAVSPTAPVSNAPVTTAPVTAAPTPAPTTAPTTAAPVEPTPAPFLVFTPAPAKPTTVPATSGKKPKATKGVPTTKKAGKKRVLRQVVNAAIVN